MKASSEIRRTAKKFVEQWTFRRGSEKGEDQQFWNTLLAEVLGMDNVAARVQYQVPVPMQRTTKFLDAWIPETRVLIEHKSRGVNLDEPQAGHDGKTPYEQAVEYDNARPFDEKARWIVTCNFDEWRIYDRTKPLAPPLRLSLGNLPKEVHRLAFLINPTEKAIPRELEISVQAGRIVGEIYDALLKQYNEGSLLSLRGDSESRSLGEDSKKSPCLQNSKTPSSESNYLAALNRLCVRLVFCLYAEDADIFPKDCFRRLLENTPSLFLRERLIRLFQTLDTPTDKRNPYLDAELCAFPYTNGGLFHNAVESEIPPITDDLRQLLIGSSQFDWHDITPTIFGALFESTLNPVTRRAGGMVYTSVENIHKVIDPLFLDDLTSRVEAAIKRGDKRTLLALQAEMASRTFLDPACGSGNFLTETYICLRRLENRIIAALQKGQGEFDLGLTIKVSIAQFYGLEINDFAVAVAKTALWIAESQMMEETAEILHREPDYLPLKDNANIVEGNALRMDWPHTNYIIGNPPFSGAMKMKGEKREDIKAVFPECAKVGEVDYVSGWYAKAARLIAGSDSRCAFVSTNSLCQGQSVSLVWKPLVEQMGVVIDFAHRTFRWDNESTEKARVHCIIVAFHVHSASRPLCVAQSYSKIIFDGGRATPSNHINAYLVDAPDLFIDAVRDPVFGQSPMHMGVMARDGGNLILSQDEYDYYVKHEPQGAQWLRRYMMGKEFINNIPRWCFWLVGADPAALRRCPLLLGRIAKVREARLASPALETRKLADTPTLFAQLAQPKTNFIAFPKVSSENRLYVPIGFMSPDVIVGDKIYVVENVGLYEFGILTSSVHNAWMRMVAGRLESRYSYSNTIVYNTFPWPVPGETQSTSRTLHETISQTAQVVLDERAHYPNASLADLYDPLTMPPDLRAAHEANDRAVLAAYGLAPDSPEPEIVAHLFKLYADMTARRTGK